MEYNCYYIQPSVRLVTRRHCNDGQIYKIFGTRFPRELEASRYIHEIPHKQKVF